MKTDWTNKHVFFQRKPCVMFTFTFLFPDVAFVRGNCWLSTLVASIKVSLIHPTCFSVIVKWTDLHYIGKNTFTFYSILCNHMKVVSYPTTVVDARPNLKGWLDRQGRGSDYNMLSLISKLKPEVLANGTNYYTNKHICSLADDSFPY